MTPLLTLRAEHYFSSERPIHVARNRGEFACGRHTHARYFEFFLILQGRATHWINGHEETLEPGSLVLIREKDQHGMQPLPGQTVRYVNVAYAQALLEEAVRFLDAGPWFLHMQTPGKQLSLRLRGAERREFVRRLDAACGLFPGEDAGLRLLLLEVLDRLLPAPVRIAGGRDRKELMPTWLEELCTRLRQPGHNLREVTELPALAHKSAEHLARSFRRYLGVTPTQFLNALRLDEAARRLAFGDEKILSIAFDCRFEQPNYFYRLFRRRFGCTPLRYRQMGRRLAGE